MNNGCVHQGWRQGDKLREEVGRRGKCRGILTVESMPAAVSTTDWHLSLFECVCVSERESVCYPGHSGKQRAL